MKSLFTLLLFSAVFSFGASAQDEQLTRPQTTAPVAGEAVAKGNWLVGASIGNIGHNFKSETFTFDINPRAGYFISDNAAIGAQVQLGFIAFDGGEDIRYGLTP